MESKGQFLHSTKTRFALAVGLFLAAMGLGACGSSDTERAARTCLEPSTLEPSAPLTQLRVRMTYGSTPLTWGEGATFPDGSAFKATKARFFLSEIALVSDAGDRVPAELVGPNGARLPYGLALVDFERPESLGLQLRAPAGHYRAIAVSMGVPSTCESGERLNHSDASSMKAPLDVDSDMFWGWNPGYVFLKFEGQVSTPRWESFFFHIGGDSRLVRYELPYALTLSASGGEGPEIVADFEKLLLNRSEPNQRRVHDGPLADELAQNVRDLGFLRIESAPH